MKKANKDEHVEKSISENKLNVENNTLSRISAMMVHDIKNPLNNILLACAAMDDMQLHEDQKNCVDLIRRNSNRINSLMTDLSFATNAGLRFNIQPVNIHSLVKDVLQAVQNTKHFNRIAVHYNYEVNIPHQQIDNELMAKALFNVLLNAFEAVDEEKGVIEIAVRSTDGINCVIELKDNGTGIAQENEREIFEPCFTTKPGHNGLGLSIAKNILKQHNGSLSLLKNNGEGTIFVIRMSGTTKAGDTTQLN